MSRAAGKAQTLQKLRQSGRDVLLEVGVHQASIQDITTRAGLAIGTFYVHFEGKGELVDSLVEELNAGLAQSMLAVFMAPPLPPARELVAKLARVVVDYWAAHARELPLLADHVARHANEEILQVGANPQVVALTRALVRAVPALQLGTSPELMVAMIVSMWRAAGRLAASVDAAERETIARDVARATEALFETFAPGLLDADATTLVVAAFGALEARK